MARLYLSIQQYQPRFLSTTPAGPESYSHDGDVTYLILQPFVLEPTQGSAIDDQMFARDYLRFWSAARLAAEGVWLIGANEVARINSGTVRPCPVPLPPGTQLSFSLEATTRSGAKVTWSDARPLGLQAPPAPSQWDQLDGDAALGWPAFAALSNALPPVRSWAELDGGAATGPQKHAAVLGLLGVFSRMATIWAGADPDSMDDRALVWKEVVKPILKPTPPKKPTPLDDTVAWRAHLEKARPGGGTNGSWAYDLLLPISKRDIPLNDEPIISLPGFQWTADGVRARPDLFLQSGQTERGYLDALWCELRGLAEREANAAGRVDLPINQMMGRLFGFGERLAWPISRVDGGLKNSKRIMALRENLSHVGNLPQWIDGKVWLATNVVSLTGLVLRMPWNDSDPLETVTESELRIGGKAVEQEPGALTNLLKLGFDELASVPARTPGLARASFGGPAGEQPTPASQPDRIVFYAARRGPMPRLEGHTPVNRVLYAAPEALLDVVDSGQRFVDRGADGAVVRNAPRRALFRHELLNESEVLPKGIDGKEVHAWHRRQIELVPRRLTGSGSIAYALRLVEAVHRDESFVEGWVGSLGTGAGFPEAWLWIPVSAEGKGAELRLSAALLARDADGATLVLDPDPKAAGSLSEILGYEVTQPKSFQVEVAFRTTDDPSGIFDVVEWPLGVTVKPPDLVLAKAPLTRLARSADRLAGAIRVTWPVQFDPDYGVANLVHPDVQAVQFSETNKLRLNLALPVGGLIRNLSDPDAQLPLPSQLSSDMPGPDRPWTLRGDVSAAGPQAWYWFAEHFDQDIAALDDEAEEETRFQLWNGPDKPLTISGYLEHQFGHRIGLELPDVQFRRSVDVRNAADAMVPERLDAGRAGATNKRQPLLQLVEETDSKKPAILRVVVRREALKLALDQYAAGAPGQLRDLYRALAELHDALAKGVVEIAVESWIYDNTKVTASGAHATLGLGMRPTAIKLVPSASLVGTDLEKLFFALRGTFKDFVKLCRKLSTKIGPLAVLYDAPSADFDKLASMVRVRLTITRPDAVRAEPDWANGAFVPLADSGPEAGSALAKTAQDDLNHYLSNPGSRLSTSVAWIESADTRAAEKGMGPGASKFLVPKGETAPVNRVADLFYMPHAFMLPDAHPLLGDRRATVDFLGFLLQLAEDILTGRSVDDRLKLTDTLTGADAVALRRAVRSILEQEPDGAVARMMRLFRRVDVPPSTAGASLATQLHWHAGQVLDSLAGLRKPPHTLLRERLLEIPTLFSSLRAIGVGVFNRRLARAPDPAPTVNHSTFSAEMIEIGITKRLIDDREAVKKDADRFPASDFQGGILAGEPAFYFLDLLPDHVYDDLVEIRVNAYRGVEPTNGDLFGLPRSIIDVEAAGDAVAVRGEDVLYEPAKPSLAANVVHVFPDWRVLEDRPPTPRRLRTYYLLPERLPPLRARSVDANQDGVPCGRTEISLDFQGAVGTPPQISPDAKWSVQYDKEVHKRLDAVTVTPADGSPKSYRRILKASASTGPARYLPRAVAPAGRQTAGWHLLSTYLSHFWFELDLQKPGESWSVNLEDDTYEVEVEMWNGTPPPSEGQSSDLPASDDPLLQAYRQLRHAAQVTPPTPLEITCAKLEEGLDAWLRRGREGRTLLEAPQRIGEKAPRGDAKSRTFRITRPVGDGAWTLTETTTGVQHDGIGAVVAFEVLARTRPDATSGPRYDDTASVELASVLIRISVLDTPALVSRARLRVVRNWRDVGNDGIPDIAPEFFLAERFSAWKSEGRAPLVINFARTRVPPEGQQIRARKASALTDWLEAIDHLNKTVDHGSDLVAALDAKVFHNIDTGADENLWEPWMKTAGFNVDGLIVRSAPDLSFLFGKGPAPLAFATRDLSLAGDPLPSKPADRLAEVLAEVRPSAVKGDRPSVMLVWRDRQNMSVLEVSLPLNLKP
ncbi:hypothetical protein [Roseomonas rosulenta]|uniref:hypothetical protein n=1 Tax=Roseomonas rosulenta TaxID=2748667 RepID=UPI0018DFC00F|nr:hypothetical protein [Roseomonas rosulenta]